VLQCYSAIVAVKAPCGGCASPQGEDPLIQSLNENVGRQIWEFEEGGARRSGVR